MRKFILKGLIVGCLAVAGPPAAGAQSSARPAFSEEVVEAWERLQRALQDWGGRLWDSAGMRRSREERPLISQMLRQKETLGLSSDQARRLEQLRDDFQRQSIRSEADLKIIEMDIAALLERDPVNTTEVEAKVRQGEKLRADIRIARIRVIEQAKSVLDAEQRKKLQELTPSAAMPRPGRGERNPSVKE